MNPIETPIKVERLLVQPANNDALAAAMLRLLADPVLSANLAGAGINLARRELSFEEKAELVLESYLRALDQVRLTIGQGPTFARVLASVSRNRRLVDWAASPQSCRI
jgi:hypothetical protein